MKIYFAVFVFQLFFNVFKTMEIKYTYENKIKALLMNSIWINLVGLGSTYFSLERLFAHDWIIIVVFIAGSIVGKWFAMTHFENYRQKLYQLLNLKKEKLD